MKLLFLAIFSFLLTTSSYASDIKNNVLLIYQEDVVNIFANPSCIKWCEDEGKLPNGMRCLACFKFSNNYWECKQRRDQCVAGCIAYYCEKN